jgi:hypothetical protein
MRLRHFRRAVTGEVPVIRRRTGPVFGAASSRWAGLAFGLAGGLVSGRLLGTVLYGVAPNDLYTVSGVVVGVMITSVAASYVPARRATRPDVLGLLRDA